MPINNVNGPIGPGRPAKSTKDAAPLKSGRPERISRQSSTSEATSTQDVTVAEQTTARDTVQIRRYDKQVEEMTAKVEQMDDSPREEAVSRATDRVRSGYYSKPEFMEQLALKLINTEPSGG